MNDNERVRAMWGRVAPWWQETIGDEDRCHRHLIFPALDQLLALRPGERVLDVACGIGNLARRLTKAGASVVAFDFTPEMLAIARARTAEASLSIDFRELDATDPAALAGLGAGAFDAVVASMALQDIADIEPLLAAVPHLLKPGGRFVFSVPHPCFNTSRTVGFREETYGSARVLAGVRVTEYLQPFVEESRARSDQPHPYLVFDRPLHHLFGSCLRQGLVLDGLLEPAPPESMRAEAPEPYSRWSRLPVVLVTRWRPGSEGP